MGKALRVSAIAEITTGLALVIAPSLVGTLLLGVGLEGQSVIVARVAGIALISLGISCWPGPPILGMTVYSAAVSVLFAHIWITSVSQGVALWLALVIHLVLTVALTLELARIRRGKSG